MALPSPTLAPPDFLGMSQKNQQAAAHLMKSAWAGLRDINVDRQNREAMEGQIGQQDRGYAARIAQLSNLPITGAGGQVGQGGQVGAGGHAGGTAPYQGDMPSWLRMANDGKIRDMPLSADLVNALGYLGDMGITMEVFSGGQAPKGSGGKRTGSVRHDHGNAADVFFYRDGQRLNHNNPEHQPIFSEIVSRGRANGLSGFGAGPGYMADGSMHIGFGNNAVWGASMSSDSAPEWLTRAYNSPWRS